MKTSYMPAPKVICRRNENAEHPEEKTQTVLRQPAH